MTLRAQTVQSARTNGAEKLKPFQTVSRPGHTIDGLNRMLCSPERQTVPNRFRQTQKPKPLNPKPLLRGYCLNTFLGLLQVPAVDSLFR